MRGYTEQGTANMADILYPAKETLAEEAIRISTGWMSSKPAQSKNEKAE